MKEIQIEDAASEFIGSELHLYYPEGSKVSHHEIRALLAASYGKLSVMVRNARGTVRGCVILETMGSRSGFHFRVMPNVGAC
ncbi:hypothetical protein GCM10008955_01050 [Deinococcus malanensis]|uniref:Uncharacterized protein n=1 Tax=Deinococcus malanensis TaxID=1706855 RepID=A0ABQ2EHE9_9DEIO|nr:hypothetical protein [Deinococcus malanensis]GGK11614.1 hypothetical protein GCM10008955_01050 [Deinococcus malanensis]